MKCPTKEALQRLREQYPAGCRVMLDKMDDPQAPLTVGKVVCRAK